MASIFKRAGKNGRYSWYIRYRDSSGRDVKKKVPARTKREAEYYLAKTLEKLEDGTYQLEIRQYQTRFFEIADDFLEYSRAHKRSWERDEISVQKLKKFFGDIPCRLITRLERVLKRLPRNSEYVFTYKGSRLRDIRSAFMVACKGAGIDDFRFHDLPHCFVTRMRRKGVPDRVIMAITGHQTLECFKRYDNIFIDDLKQAVG